MRARMPPLTSQVISLSQTTSLNSLLDDRVTNSTPMKLSRSVSPKKPTSAKAKTESQWEKAWKQIRAAELAANKAAANNPDHRSLKKRGSEIMVSSSEDDVGLDSSYMKWLNPETAAVIKKHIQQQRITATKNLNLD